MNVTGNKKGLGLDPGLPRPHRCRADPLHRPPADRGGAAPERPAFRLYVNDWLQLAESTGQLDEAYQRWILGRETTAREPRWSVIRDVLGWVD